MASCEQSRSVEVRQRLEQKYRLELSCFKRSLTPIPDLFSGDYQSWWGDIAFIEDLKERDKRTWDIVYRLVTPINQRLDEIERRNAQKRMDLSKGYRRKKACKIDEELYWLAIDSMYDRMELDFALTERDGGYAADGKWIAGDPKVDLTELEDALKEETVKRGKKEETLAAEINRLNGPLSLEEQYFLDHELG